jgi:hypothetical protein
MHGSVGVAHQLEYNTFTRNWHSYLYFRVKLCFSDGVTFTTWGGTY